MEVFDAGEVTRALFETRCLEANRIGLIRGAGGEAAWATPRAWVGADPRQGDLNAAAFAAFLGDVAGAAAEVVVCDEAAEEEGCTEMPVRDFLARFDGAAGLYLKDWHLQAAMERGAPAADLADGGFYRTPEWLGDDWLNAYVRRGGAGFGSGEDYRFVYIGTARTYTPFHTDVFGSYSWSLSLTGVKEWWFVSPDDMPKLGAEPPPHWLRKAHAAAVPLPPGEDYDCVTLSFGEGEKAVNVPVLRFTQRPGDMVFVPSGWGHQVWNATPCLSINHNWCNRHNVARMTELLVVEASYLDRQLLDVKELLEEQHAEAGGYAGHCEWLLHNAQAWNVAAWVEMLAAWVPRADVRDLMQIVACLLLLEPLPWGTQGLARAMRAVDVRRGELGMAS